MSVHYKFKSALEYDTVTFDGLHISVKDLKNSIIQQKRIGKSTDFDLQVTNAQTKEVYEDENVLIPKNTSLLIARIPTVIQNKSKQWEGYGGDSTPPTKLDEGGPIAKAVDLSSLDAPEDDKIKAMMSQSTQDYDPSNYMKIRGANQMGAVPPNYRCYKCHQTGHWIKDCPLSKGPEPIEIKKSTGIPLSFMVPVEGPQVQGAMMTPNGSYAVPVLDHQTYTQKPVPPVAPIQETKLEIPEDLVCSICSDLLTDAVMIPCCGNSFCDECIRSFLLESEEHECPDCHEKDISPATLIPNRFLRNSVANFKNTTGYVKKLSYKEKLDSNDRIIIEEKSKIEVEEKTVISEADSTEQSKIEEKPDVETKPSPKPEIEATTEAPPGVSPEDSPKTQSITKRISREPCERSIPKGRRHRSREHSPRRHHRNRSPPFRDSRHSEDRAATPTIDEPLTHQSNYPPPEARSYNAAAPMMGMVPQMQAPPPSLPPGYANPPAPINNFPPTSGPPPNFRLPPPGAPPYMPPGPYQVPPRPMYDSNPAPPPMYGGGYQGGSRHHRDYPMGDRRMRGRTPSGVIDDPLAAFNRMLREKDERERRAKRHRRSYSRSRSRSRSYSRSPRRMRSRSPRRRSRSRSFSISRHRFKEHHYEHDREYGRPDDRAYSRERDHRSARGPPVEHHHHHHPQQRERDYGFYDNYDDRTGRGPKGGPWGGQQHHRGGTQSTQQAPPPDVFYPSEMQQHPYAPPPMANRYPPREYQPYPNKDMPIMPPARRYDDVLPPGVEEPPIPGLENAERFDTFPSPKKEKKRSRTPDRKESNDKHKKRKRDGSADKKLVSDEEKSKKNKDRKKKKDKKESEKKKRKEKKDKHKDKKHKEDIKEDEPNIEKIDIVPSAAEEKTEAKNLYDDLLSEAVDSKVLESYGKTEEVLKETVEEELEEDKISEIPDTKGFDDLEEEKDILDLQSNDIDLKNEIDSKTSEMLAQLPEKSKWEVDDEVGGHSTSPKDSGRADMKTDKSGKVTNEVLKRAENAIFAKAINAIRPIEIKKISTDRAKLYSSDNILEETDIKSQLIIPEEKEKPATERKRIEAPTTAPRLSVKERLGIKIDDLDRIVKVDARNKSRSISPFSRRVNENNRNYGIGERRVEVMDRRRRDRERERHRERDRREFRREDFGRRDRRDRSAGRKREDRRRTKSRERLKKEDDKKDRKKRSRSKSDLDKKRDKKPRKEKISKTKSIETEEKKDQTKVEEIQAKMKPIVLEKTRKPTLVDESNFEPDYDLESESEKEEKRIEKKIEEKKKSSSSSDDSSETSSDDEKKKKKHKRHRKKRGKKDSSSSSSDSDSESSDDDKKKKKQHKRKQKKRKKSKHK